MSELDNLTRAIEALEKQRPNLGDAVVDAALASLNEKLAALRAELIGEQRRLVSILFADLVGFTALATDMDPEEVSEVMNGYFQRWSASVRRHGGVVEKFIGDAVLAVFGFPTAHEDDAERAVRTGLDMQRELDELNREFEQERGLHLRMRVGINTGEVVVGLVGERGGEELVVVGEAVNLASRVQAAAPENGVLITTDTARHVTGVFDTVPYGPLELKGVDHPVEAYLVTSAKPRTFYRPRLGLGDEQPLLVGREHELELLRSAFAQARDDRQTRSITLVGEAGIGKSRLMSEFDEWLTGTGDEVKLLRGRAQASSQRVPFSLIRDILAEHAGIHDSDPPETVREKLHGDVAALLGEEQAATEADLIARLLGFEVGPLADLEGVDPHNLNELARAHLREYFRAAGSDSSAVVLCEDLHWADDASLEFIPALASLSEAAILVVGSARPPLLERRPDWGKDLSHHDLILLRPLSAHAGEALLVGSLGGGGPLPEQLRNLVLTTAEGNPFYIEELAKMLFEDGVVIQTEGGWKMREEHPSALRVPPTLTGVLQARFDTLEPQERRCLQHASVLGRVFWDKAVDSLTTGAGATLDQAAAPILDRLGSREMVLRHDPPTFEETREYLFKHALLRDVTYSTLLKRQRRVYHGLAARWLEAVTGRAGREGEFSRVIADHYLQAEERFEAADWYLRAGKAAASQFANRAALEALGLALGLMPDADPAWRAEVLLEREEVNELLADREQQRLDLDAAQAIADEIDDRHLGATVGLRRARLAFETSQYDVALEHARSAEALALDADDRALAARSAVLQAATMIRQGELDEGAGHAERALKLVADSDLPKIEADATRQIGLASYYRAKPQEALAHFARTLELYRKAEDKQGEGIALNNLGGATFDIGDFKAAGRYYQESLALCRSIGDRHGEGRALNNLGIIAVTQGDDQVAEERYLQALAISRETHHRSFEMSALDNLGNLAQFRYQYSQAERYHLECLAGARELGDRVTEVKALHNVVRCYLALGQIPLARSHSEENLELAKTLDDGAAVCRELFSLGQCEEGVGAFDEGLKLGLESLALAVSGDFPSEQGWALHVVASSLFSLGRFDEAADHWRMATEVRSGLDEPKETMESRAAWAAALLETSDRGAAMDVLEPVLAYLEDQGDKGFSDPAHLLFHCHQVLRAKGDPRAAELLRHGRELVETVASQIETDEMRQSYVAAVPSVFRRSG